MYVKINNDVIYIDDFTIKMMIEIKVVHSKKLLVFANIINNLAMSWIHYYLIRIILSYLFKFVRLTNKIKVS